MKTPTKELENWRKYMMFRRMADYLASLGPDCYAYAGRVVDRAKKLFEDEPSPPRTQYHAMYLLNKAHNQIQGELPAFKVFVRVPHSRPQHGL
jgi:hypothetical protein